MLKTTVLIAAIVVSAAFRPSAAQSPAVVSSVELISLGDREIRVKHFGLVDANAIIARVRHSGMDRYQVTEERLSTALLPPQRDRWNKPFNVRTVVPFANDRSEVALPFLSIDPHSQAVMFARARVDDANTNIAVVATKADLRTRSPGTIAFELYKIEQPNALDGDEDLFRLVVAWTTAVKYCDYTFALAETFGVKSPRLAKIDRCN